MLKFSSILLFSENPKQLAEFYEKVLGKKPDMVDESGYFGFTVGGMFITIGPHDKVKGTNPNPERMMLNFETNEVREEFERIKNLGVSVVAEPYGEDALIATFSDPDGNFFQLLPPWNESK